MSSKEVAIGLTLTSTIGEASSTKRSSDSRTYKQKITEPKEGNKIYNSEIKIVGRLKVYEKGKNSQRRGSERKTGRKKGG